MRKLTIAALPGRLAVCRLDPGEQMPAWAVSGSISPNSKFFTAKDTQRSRWVPGTPRFKMALGENEGNF